MVKPSLFRNKSKSILIYKRNATDRRFMGKKLSPCIKQYIKSKNSRNNRLILERRAGRSSRKDSHVMYCFISALCKTIHNCKYVLFYIRNATARRFMGKKLSPCIKQYIKSKNSRNNRPILKTQRPARRRSRRSRHDHLANLSR